MSLSSCKKEVTYPMVAYYSGPLYIQMAYSDSDCIFQGSTLILQAPSYEPNQSYLWSTGDTGSEIIVKVKGDYAVTTMTLTDTVLYELSIIDCDYSFYIPEAFSPNSNGDNDWFFPQGQGIAAMSMVVFNQNGKEIFVLGADDGLGWRGKDENGNLMQAGDYPYRIRYQTFDDSFHTVDGIVELQL